MSKSAMLEDVRREIFLELDQLWIIDPHTHIDPRSPASTTLADILGYHYYTELAHSAGMAKEQIEQPGLDPRAKVGRLIENLAPIQNTIQYAWLVEMAQRLFDFPHDRVTPDNWQSLYDEAARRMAQPQWAERVLQKSKLKGVFLTNDFDDPLEGFDTSVYIPCLRTDDLVFHMAKPQVRQRLAAMSGVSVGSSAEMRRAVGQLFEHFVRHQARACAISLPPSFSPRHVPDREADSAYALLAHCDGQADPPARLLAEQHAFWLIAEYCREFHLPFDLMIGVNRGVYQAGVYQGQDLYDSRVSLIQYSELFNSFPGVTFPISVLASVTNQELTSFAWIFPNVVTNGHWWYSNTPTFIEQDASARLEAVPQSKQIGYYSDMYKLEFALPKFNMYKRILAGILAERFVQRRQWSIERAVQLGRCVLQENTERLFGIGHSA